MSVIRSTLMICITVLISVGVTLLYMYNQERFSFVQFKDGVLVFDKKTSAVNFCDDKRCVQIPSQFLSKIDNKNSDNVSLIPQKQSFMSMNSMMPQSQQNGGMMQAQPYAVAPVIVMPQGFVSAQQQQAVVKNQNSSEADDIDGVSSQDDSEKDNKSSSSDSDEEADSSSSSDSSSDEESSSSSENEKSSSDDDDDN